MISICWQLIAFCWCLKDIACGPKVQLLPIGFRNGRLKYFEPDRGVRIPDIPYRFPDASFFKTVTLHRLLLLNIGDKSRHFDDIAVRIYSLLSSPPSHYKTRYTYWLLLSLKKRENHHQKVCIGCLFPLKFTSINLILGFLYCSKLPSVERNDDLRESDFSKNTR